MALQVARRSESVGKATITLLFEDGSIKENGNIVLSCDQAGFKALLESLVIESRKHVAKDAEIGSSPNLSVWNAATSSILCMRQRRQRLAMAVRVAAVQILRWLDATKVCIGPFGCNTGCPRSPKRSRRGFPVLC